MSTIYTESAEYAREHNELEQYRESKNADRECAKCIDAAIRENFDGMYLRKGCEDAVVEAFGIDRVKRVLAFTVKEKDYDGRFGRDVKDWALGFPTQPDTFRIIAEAHPAILDGFIRRIIHSYP